MRRSCTTTSIAVWYLVSSSTVMSSEPWITRKRKSRTNLLWTSCIIYCFNCFIFLELYKFKLLYILSISDTTFFFWIYFSYCSWFFRCVYLTVTLLWLTASFQTLTPQIGFGRIAAMLDYASVLLPFLGLELHTPGQVEVPVLFEGQVCLIGGGQLGCVPHQLDGDVGRVEVAHVA